MREFKQAVNEADPNKEALPAAKAEEQNDARQAK